MRLKKLIFLLITGTFWLVPLLHAGNLDELFSQANQAYRAESYNQAINLYKKILMQGYESKAVYYNIGNSYYRLNEIGNAILFYEKARKLDKNDPDVNFNLELANLKVIDRIQIPPRFFLLDWWDQIKTQFSLLQLKNLFLISYAVTLLLFIIWLFLRRYGIRRLFFGLALVSSAVLLFSTYLFLSSVHREKNETEAILLAPSVNVLSAPDESSTDVFVIHEGSKVKLNDKRGNWVEISLPDGNTGWVKSETLGII